jgi:hypothetical protein
VTHHRKQVKVGDPVTFQLGTHRRQARVIENRGQLGVGGAHVFRLGLGEDENEPIEFELAEDLLELVEPRYKGNLGRIRRERQAGSAVGG